MGDMTRHRANRLQQTPDPAEVHQTQLKFYPDPLHEPDRQHVYYRPTAKHGEQTPHECRLTPQCE